MPVIQNTNWYGTGYAGTGTHARTLSGGVHPGIHLAPPRTGFVGHVDTSATLGSRQQGVGLLKGLGGAVKQGVAAQQQQTRSRAQAFQGVQPVSANAVQEVDQGYKTPLAQVPPPSLYNWATETPRSRAGSFASRLAGNAVKGVAGALRKPQAPF